MKNWIAYAIVMGGISVCANIASAADVCITAQYSVQTVLDSGGNLRLYVYSQQFGGSNYLTYSGNNDVLKAFHAQFLYAQANGHVICAQYTAGSPSYTWNLSGVGIPTVGTWPYQ